MLRSLSESYALLVELFQNTLTTNNTGEIIGANKVFFLFRVDKQQQTKEKENIGEGVEIKIILQRRGSERERENKPPEKNYTA